MKTLKPVFLAVVLFALAGCVGINIETDFIEDPNLHSQVLSQDSDAFPGLDPIFTSDEIKAYLATHVSSTMRGRRLIARLQDLLFDEEYLDIQYNDDRTQTASETFLSRKGNCLSVMNLFISMARHLQLNASFQLVKVRPNWDRKGKLFILNEHINATGRAGSGLRYVVDFTPEITLQQLTESTVTDEEARALYFNNLGVEELVKENADAALVYFKNALWINPTLSISWNNIGTTFNRLERKDLAEYSYQMSYELDGNATAVNNLGKFYESNGDTVRARAYRAAVFRFNQQNPYYHFERGNTAFQQNQYQEAVKHYRKAIKRKGVEPDFYEALALAYARLNNLVRAREMNDRAKKVLAENAEIYQPSDDKLRMIDERSILRNTSPGISILISPNGRQ